MDLPQNPATAFLTRRAVLIFIGIATVVLIVADLALAADDVQGNTYSEILRSAARFTPVVPWLSGLVVGHWFHPFSTAEPRLAPPGNWLALLALTAVVAIIGLMAEVPPWVPVLPGAVAGALLWPVATEVTTFADVREESG